MLREADSLDGMPVVVADLHSALPAILGGLYARTVPAPRVAYVMPDGGALPAWFSMSVRAAAGGRLAGRGGHGRARRSAATWRR